MSRPVTPGAEMSFNEIARELGIRQQTVYKAYVNGMKKLAARPELLLPLARLAGDLQAARNGEFQINCEIRSRVGL